MAVSYATDPADTVGPIDTGSTTTTTPTPGTTAASHVDTAPTSTADALSVDDLLGYTTPVSALGEEGNEMIEKVSKWLQPEGIAVEPINGVRSEGRVFTNSAKQAVTLLFEETYSSMDSTPPSVDAPMIAKNQKQGSKGYSPLQTIVVCKEDYKKQKQWYANLSNIFKVSSMTEFQKLNMNIESFRNQRYSICTNMEYVRAFVSRYSPHAVPARDDIGMLLCIDKRQTGLDGQQTTVQVPILAITGYTRFIDDSKNGLRGLGTINRPYLPIVIITDIVSPLVSPHFAAMALAMAADGFINRKLWLRPYQSFQTTKLNFGYFDYDPATGKCIPNKTENDFWKTLGERIIQTPYLAIDVAEGRSRPVNIDNLASNQARFVQFFKNTAMFFNHKEVTPDELALFASGCFAQYRNTIGVYNDKGTLRDSRCVDYLSVAPHVNDPRSLVEVFLHESVGENTHFDAVKELYGGDGTRPLYTNTTVLLTAPLINWINMQITQNNVVFNYDVAESGTVDLSMLYALGDNVNYRSFGTNSGMFFAGANASNFYSNIPC